MVLAGALALFEFYRLCFGDRSHSWLIGIGLTGFAALILGTHWPDIIVPTLLATLVCIISVPLLSRSPLEQSLRDGAMTLFGVLYLGLTLSTLSMTRLLPQGEWLIFFLATGDLGIRYRRLSMSAHCMDDIALAPIDQSQKNCRGLGGRLDCCHNRRVRSSLVVSP